MNDELLEPEEVSRLVRRSVGWLAKARVTGLGPRFLKVGGKVLYRRSAVETWLAGCERSSTWSYGRRRKGRGQRFIRNGQDSKRRRPSTNKARMPDATTQSA